MARTTPRPRARLRARLCIAGLLLVSAASLQRGVVAWADEQNTIAFEPGPGHSCAARPRPSSITVSQGTKVVFANDTASAATLQLDGQAQPGSIAPGAEVALSLAMGQHQVVLVLPCGGSKAAIVIVSGASATPQAAGTTPQAAGTTPKTDGTTPKTAPPAGGTSAAGRVPQQSGDGPPAAVVSPPVGAPNGTSSSQVVPDGRSDDAPLSPVLGASPAGLDQPDSPTRLGPLAIVATLCVLGVAVMIVRSILRLSR